VVVDLVVLLVLVRVERLEVIDDAFVLLVHAFDRYLAEALLPYQRLLGILELFSSDPELVDLLE
jgi:hypothetical protein